MTKFDKCPIQCVYTNNGFLIFKCACKPKSNLHRRVCNPTYLYYIIIKINKNVPIIKAI